MDTLLTPLGAFYMHNYCIRGRKDKKTFLANHDKNGLKIAFLALPQLPLITLGKY